MTLWLILVLAPRLLCQLLQVQLFPLLTFCACHHQSRSCAGVACRSVALMMALVQPHPLPRAADASRLQEMTQLQGGRRVQQYWWQYWRRKGPRPQQHCVAWYALLVPLPRRRRCWAAIQHLFECFLAHEFHSVTVEGGGCCAAGLLLQLLQAVHPEWHPQHCWCRPAWCCHLKQVLHQPRQHLLVGCRSWQRPLRELLQHLVSLLQLQHRQQCCCLAQACMRQGLVACLIR